jgi:hypothetical protein
MPAVSLNYLMVVHGWGMDCLSVTGGWFRFASGVGFANRKDVLNLDLGTYYYYIFGIGNYFYL